MTYFHEERNTEMIPIFFILFVIFLIIFNHAIHKDTMHQEELERKFWLREQEANHVRKKNISNLPFIQLKKELIPGNLHTEAEEKLLALCDKNMLNLTPYTNTDLKLLYGTGNLNELSVYEDLYVEMITQLSIYTKELLEAQDIPGARQLLEFAISCKEDSFFIYEQLGLLYASSNDTESLQKLLDSAESITTVTKTGILTYLSNLLASLD